eukprot:TRINITY_DN7827_c0_g1_i1.p2 TRINITY_DN7827_c0_g1~~TRINITY_DN7827_c0_g1_i1.p2  ORF type:complete len:157 (+),score=31.20 TRINITY_DN7827_c0_g1_i1:367-837(+)
MKNSSNNNNNNSSSNSWAHGDVILTLTKGLDIVDAALKRLDESCRAAPGTDGKLSNAIGYSWLWHLKRLFGCLHDELCAAPELWALGRQQSLNELAACLEGLSAEGRPDHIQLLLDHDAYPALYRVLKQLSCTPWDDADDHDNSLFADVKVENFGG